MLSHSIDAHDALNDMHCESPPCSTGCKYLLFITRAPGGKGGGGTSGCYERSLSARSPPSRQPARDRDRTAGRAVGMRPRGCRPPLFFLAFSLTVCYNSPMSSPHPSLADAFAELRCATLAAPAPVWLPIAVHTLLLACLLRLIDSLANLIALWQAGQLPPQRPPRSRAAMPDPVRTAPGQPLARPQFITDRPAAPPPDIRSKPADPVSRNSAGASAPGAARHRRHGACRRPPRASLPRRGILHPRAANQSRAAPLPRKSAPDRRCAAVSISLRYQN